MSRHWKNKPTRNYEKPEFFGGRLLSSRVNSSGIGQNFDFSNFSLLCEKVYELLELDDPYLRRQMPYCVFFHAMNEYLNAYLIQNNKPHDLPAYKMPLQSIDAGSRLIPTPIFEYINGIGMVETASGLEVRFNLPIGGSPQGPLDETDDADAMESGSFGSCTAETHNSYECYVSPYVTRKLIERTLYANTSTDPDRFGDWSPLPRGRCPENGIANRNLLGYQKPEKLEAERVEILKNLDFCSDDTIYGRVCHSSNGLSRVSGALSRLSHQIEVTEVKLFNIYDYDLTSKLKENSAAFIYLDLSKHIAKPNESIAEFVDILSSPESFDRHAANKAYYFGYKRKRSPGSVGPCYTVVREVPKGWEETLNNNFNMIGRFAAENCWGLDRASLRNNDHIVSTEMLEGTSRGKVIGDWLDDFITKKAYILEKKN